MKIKNNDSWTVEPTLDCIALIDDLTGNKRNPQQVELNFESEEPVFILYHQYRIPIWSKMQLVDNSLVFTFPDKTELKVDIRK